MVDAEPVQKMYHALVSRDFDSLRATLADGAIMDFGGQSRFAGSHRGREAVALVLEGMAVLEPKLPDAWDICTSDHHAVLMDWFEARSDGHTFLGYVAFVCAVESGRIVRIFPFFEEQYAFDQFFAPEAE